MHKALLSLGKGFVGKPTSGLSFLGLLIYVKNKPRVSFTITDSPTLPRLPHHDELFPLNYEPNETSPPFHCFSGVFGHGEEKEPTAASKLSSDLCALRAKMRTVSEGDRRATGKPSHHLQYPGCLRPWME